MLIFGKSKPTYTAIIDHDKQEHIFNPLHRANCSDNFCAVICF